MTTTQPLNYASPSANPDIDRQYRYWRTRILLTSIVGYALFYFVRSNISVPLKAIGAELHYTKQQLGLITTIGGVTYGISKFINGFFGDHANPRWFMAVGLLACAVMNFFFGLSSTLALFSLLWFLNNYFQGMGFPPCAKSMAHWFSPKERATVFGVWHTSHMIGAALVGALTGYLVQYAGWRSCFYVPAGLAAFGAIIVYIFLRDTPESMGLPPVELYTKEETPDQLAAELHQPVPAQAQTPDSDPSRHDPNSRSKHPAPGTQHSSSLNPEPRPLNPLVEEFTYSQIVIKYVLLSPYMWIISFANLAVYVLRYAQMTWGPTFLQEYKGISVVASGWLYFGAEMGGMVAALIAGIIADRIFHGRAGRVCVIAMVLMLGAIYGFWKCPREFPILTGALYIAMGFLLYVPQMLIAAMAMNLGTKRASAAAVGLTGIVGYISTIITGYGIGTLVDKHGWPAAFQLMLACAALTLVLMSLTWNIGAHPEAKSPH